MVCQGCNAISSSFPPCRCILVLCWCLCCLKRHFLLTPLCWVLFIFSEVFTSAFNCSKCLQWDAGLWVMHECFCLGVCGYPGWEKGCPSGNTLELLHTTAGRSQSCPELWFRFCSVSVPDVVCYIFLFFTPLGIREMALSITFCEVLLGHGSIGTSCAFNQLLVTSPRGSWNMNCCFSQGNNRQTANVDHIFIFLEAQVIFLTVLS